jgi:hypothetical protein
MTAKEASDLYDRIIQVATGPVLILLLVWSLVIINRLLSPDFQRKRRNKQILKAQEERRKLGLDTKDPDKKPGPEQDR